MSVVCWENSEFTTTTENNKDIFKCADEEKSNKGETYCNKDKKGN